MRTRERQGGPYSLGNNAAQPITKELKMFYRRDENGNAVIFEEAGEVATKIEHMHSTVYPIGSNCSAYHEHPAGIILTIPDAEMIGIHEEQ